MENKRKDHRSLSPYEFLKQLQFEYVSSLLRSKIYNRENDKNYWLKVSEEKKKKISDIAERNSLPTIFNDSDLLNYYNELVFVGKSFPSFYYRDEETKNRLVQWDHIHYYKKDKYFRIESNGETLVGRLVEYKLFNNVALFKIENSEEIVEINLSKVFRIL